MGHGDTFRILSLDGGGVRGLVTAVWLAALETRAGKPAGALFDLVAGSSTGAILAAAVAGGRPAAEIVDLYDRNAPEIFPGPAGRLWSRLGRLFRHGLSAPRYSGAGLDRVLKSQFGDSTLGELPLPTLVTSYDTWGRAPVVFKSWKAGHEALPLWSVCRASCSAPGYFPAQVMQLGDHRRPLIDGGIVANNPAACALAEGWKIIKGQDRDPANIVLASFGTGEATRPIGIDQAREWGPLEWALPIIGTLFDGAADAAHYIVTQILDEDRYFRIQAPLERALDDLDAASRANLAALRETADAYLRGAGGRRIDALAECLLRC
jgi:patatin-like phospholipase/acyl hydrolase